MLIVVYHLLFPDKHTTRLRYIYNHIHLLTFGHRFLYISLFPVVAIQSGFINILFYPPAAREQEMDENDVKTSFSFAHSASGFYEVLSIIFAEDKQNKDKSFYIVTDCYRL